MLQLSKREIKIIWILLDNEISITTKELAEKLQMSVRTIKYDLDNIKYWLESYGLTLSTRRNKGIWLELSEKEKKELKNELLLIEKYEIYPSQGIRISKIISLLCYQNGFITTKQLADYLDVSNNTIVTDLNKVEIEIEHYDLILTRKNYFGFAIDGEEKDVRILLEAVIQKGMTDYDVYHITQVISNKLSEKEIINLKLAMLPEMQEIYKVTLLKVNTLLEKGLITNFDYSGLLSVILKVSISAFRMKLNRTINRYKLLGSQEVLQEKNELPYLLIKEVFEFYGLPILEEEYIYVFSDILINYKENNIAELTRKIISFVSQVERLPYDKDKQLFTNLFAHFSIKLNKKHLFVNEYNPFIEDIKDKHSNLFKAIKKACEEEISKSISIISDSFVAFIALHFLTSYERISINHHVVRVVYVCSTGLGVTNLVQQKIIDVIPNVVISGFASVMDAKEVIRKTNPDLIVSIFPLENIEIPFIKVSPLPTENDLEAIRTLSENIITDKDGNHQHIKLAVKNKSNNGLDLENVSKDITLKSFLVYEELKPIFVNKMQKDYEEAFLLHVFMMVHRIYFKNQYENNSTKKDESIKILERYAKEEIEIREIVSKNNLNINDSEIVALLQYLTL